MQSNSRRGFLRQLSVGAGIVGAGSVFAAEKPIQGFDETETKIDEKAVWQPVSDRKIRVGIVGYGYCRFGAAFGYQDHPNVEVVAVSDLIPERRAGLAKACRCEKTYPSLEELVKDDSIEAVYVATDAPSHFKHCMNVLKHGKHVVCAVPSVWGSLEDADALFEMVKSSGLNYQLNETSVFKDDCYAMRKVYEAGHFGRMVYSEGEYYHYLCAQLDSYKDWRIGMPPQYYPTHSNAYHVGVTGESFTEVSCMGIPSVLDHLKPENNVYKNPFGTEIALFRTSGGGMSRMGVSWDTPGYGGEIGRVRGEKGSMRGTAFQGLDKLDERTLRKGPLPPGVGAGGHGGSHGYLTDEFVHSILENRKPLVDIAWGLNMTVSGIVAHESALKDGELLKIPQYSFG
ncbi:MAG: Gfo/Idh/MocA family oxidoreductase [Candidatus Hydrogenedentes bacterium]|nr:Gfo/Idh/MocA family oxidoreductase [Candidatus Hydrogenedentota bacterium]